MSTTVRTYSPPAESTPLPEQPKDDTGVDVEIKGIEPLELREDRSGDVLLEALGLEDSMANLPIDQQENVKEVKQYVKDVMKQKGRTETVQSFTKTLDELKEYVGLDEQADPDAVIDRLGNLVKSYKSLLFIKDPGERRSLFMRLARQQTSQDMDRLVFEEMTRRQVWQ